jgi:transposase InsO family protein
VYCQLKRNHRRRGKQQLLNRNPTPLRVGDAVNVWWSADFMFDTLWNGRSFRTFNVVDDFNREALARGDSAKFIKRLDVDRIMAIRIPETSSYGWT